MGRANVTCMDKKEVRLGVEGLNCVVGGEYIRNSFIEHITQTEDATLIELYDNMKEYKLAIWHYLITLQGEQVESIEVNDSSVGTILIGDTSLSIANIKLLGNSSTAYTYCTCPEFYKNITPDDAVCSCNIAHKRGCSNKCIYYTLKHEKVRLNEYGVDITITADHRGKLGISKISLIDK